jgi:RHS repeat-associated protein
MQKAGQNITFKYNAQGIRTEKTVNGVTTQYHLVGDQVTYETDGTDKIYYTYDSAGNLVSMNYNGIEYYYVYNAQKDIIALIDASGNEVVSYTYDTWGKLLSIEGTLKDTVGIKNLYRYRSYRYDTETGLYYLQSRYYNPEWSRFINADSIVEPTGEILTHNMFVYCDNNPIVRADFNGQWWHIAAGFIIGGIFELGAQLISNGGNLQNVNWGKIGVAAATGAVTAALGPIAGAIVSGTSNVILDSMDGVADPEKLLASFTIGAVSSIAGYGAAKAVQKIGGNMAIKSLSKLPKAKIKMKVGKLYGLKGSELNRIKDISYLTRRYSDIGEKLLGKTIPQVVNSNVGGATGFGLSRLKNAYGW